MALGHILSSKNGVNVVGATTTPPTFEGEESQDDDTEENDSLSCRSDILERNAFEVKGVSQSASAI